MSESIGIKMNQIHIESSPVEKIEKPTIIPKPIEIPTKKNETINVTVTEKEEGIYQ